MGSGALKAVPRVLSDALTTGSGPVVFDCIDTKNFSTNGWWSTCRLVRLALRHSAGPGGGPRGQDTMMLEADAAGSIDREMGRSATALWLMQVARQTDLTVQTAIGTGDVVRVMMHAAYKRWPLTDIAHQYFAAKEVDDYERRALTCRTSRRAHPSRRSIGFEDLMEFIHEDAGRVERLRSEGRRPRGGCARRPTRSGRVPLPGRGRRGPTRSYRWR